ARGIPVTPGRFGGTGGPGFSRPALDYRPRIGRRGAGLFNDAPKSRFAEVSRRMRRASVAQQIMIFAVQLYRWVISPAKGFLFGPLGRCRFTPSCSEYALEAIRAHGAWHGLRLALTRLARCHPWGGCGDDPVPERR